MVQGDSSDQLRFRSHEFPEPDLGLRAGVGEHQRRSMFENALCHRPNQSGAQVAGPGISFDRFGKDRFQIDLLGGVVPYQAGGGAIRPDQDPAGDFKVSNRRRQSADLQIRRKAAQVRQSEFKHRTTLGADQLVPFVAHHRAQSLQLLMSLFPAE